MGKYLAPTTIEGTETRCAVIYFPDDPAGFFRAAVLGQLTALSHPWLWDGEWETAKEIAALFTETEHLTDGTFSNTDCELVPLVTGQEDMNITVNTNCGGGCCGGGGHGLENIYPTDWQWNREDLNRIGNGHFEDDGVSFPEEYSTREEYEEVKCQLVGQLVDDFIDSVGNMQTLGGLVGLGGAILMQALLGTAALSGVIVGLMALGLSATSAILVLISLFVALAAAGTGLFVYFGSVYTELLQQRQLIICSAYQATTTEELKQVFVDYAGTVVAGLALDNVSNGDVFGTVMMSVVDLLLPDELLMGVLRGVNELVETSKSYDCEACAAAQLPALVVSDTYVLENGWQLAAGQQRINPAGLSSTGQNYCSTRSFCRQGAVLTAHSASWSSWLRNIFTAQSGSHSFEIDNTSYDNFGQDLKVQLRKVIDGSLVEEKTVAAGGFWVPKLDTVTFGSLSIGTEYYLAFAGNGMIVSYVTHS